MIRLFRKRRKLSASGRKRLMLAMARAEEALVETHVANIFDLADALDGEVEIDRAVELYVDGMNMDEALATGVTNRLLSRLDGSR